MKLKLICLLFFITAQLSIVVGQSFESGCVMGNFGVDADILSNGSQYGGGVGIPNSDDWFKDEVNNAGLGIGIIDTSDWENMLARLQNGENFSFSRQMNIEPNSLVAGRRVIDAIYSRDYVNNDVTSFVTGNKNGDDPSQWNTGTSIVSNKTDIVDAFGHLRRDGLLGTDSLLLFVGFSRTGSNGSSNVDAELFVNEMAHDAVTGMTSGGPDDGHIAWSFNPDGSTQTIGDVIVAASYSGSGIPVAEIRIWMRKTDWESIIPTAFNFTSQFENSSTGNFGYAEITPLGGSTFGCGIGNEGSGGISGETTGPPWGTFDGTWEANYSEKHFFEIGINLTKLGIDPSQIPGATPCDDIFKSVLFKSRSSVSFSSSLKDFVGPFNFKALANNQPYIVGDTLDCANPIGILNQESPGNGTTFSWTTIDGLILSDTTQESITIGSPGTYIVFSSPLEGCDFLADTIYVPIDTLSPIASTQNDTFFNCATQIDLQAFPDNLYYYWEGPNNFVSILQNPAIGASGSYELVVTSSNGCKDTVLSQIIAQPCALADTVSTLESQPIAINELNNDTDLDADLNPGSIKILTEPNNGIANPNLSNGIIVYNPDTLFSGLDSLEYCVCDFTQLCDTAWVLINVSPICKIDNPGITTICDDNGTGSNSDDIFTFVVNPTGTELGNSYSLSGDISVSNLPYGNPQGPFGPYSISGSNLVISITDDNDANCQLSNMDLLPPASCSVCDVNIDSLNSENITVCGLNNGSIIIFANSTYPLQYSIDGGFTWNANNVFTNLSSGSYSVVVSNQDGSCQTSFPTNVTIADISQVPSIDAIIVDTLSCPINTNDGSITFISNGFGSALEYSIDDGMNWQSDSIYSNLSSGIYNLRIRSLPGFCETQYFETIVLSEPSCPEDCSDGIDNDGDGFIDCNDTDCSPQILNVNYIPTSCPDGTANGSIIITSTGLNLSYSINNGIDWQPSNEFNNLADGDYTILIRNDLGNCITPYISNPVTMIPPVCTEDCTDGIDNDGDGLVDCLDDSCVPLIILIDTINPICPTGSLTGFMAVQVLGGTGLTLYSIDNGVTFTSNSVFANLTSGSYDVVVQNPEGTCSLIYPNNPVVLSDSSCPEDCVDGIDNDANGEIDCDDLKCIPVIDSLTFQQPQCPFGSATGNISIYITSGPNPFEYSIDNGMNFQSSDQFLNLLPGSYSIFVRDVLTGCTAEYIGNPVVLDPAICIEECADGIDNDGNGFIDCFDMICQPSFVDVNVTQPFCPSITSNGIIGIDASGNGTLEYSIDGGNTWVLNDQFTGLPSGTYLVSLRIGGTTCEVDYPMNPVILNPPNCTEICNDGIDNNGNGLIDCEEVSCELNIQTILTTPISCPANSQNGIIEVVSNSPDIEYSIDSGMTYQMSPIFQNLEAEILYYVFIRTSSICATAYFGNPISFSEPVCPEVCNDNIDNDGDGFTDCDDQDCSPSIKQVIATPTVCPTNSNNGEIIISVLDTIGQFEYSIDSGLVFQYDSTFQNLPAGVYNIVVRRLIGGCVVSYPSIVFSNPVCPENCLDGIDNDGNGLTDCEDPACAPVIDSISTSIPTCVPFIEGGSIFVYANGFNLEYSIDNGINWQNDPSFINLNGADYHVIVRDTITNCSTVSPGIPLLWAVFECVEDCTDGIDNDGDGLIDCIDSDCLPPLAEFEIIRPECAAPLGSISIMMNDTLGEFDYSVDGGMNFQSDSIFNNLDTGIYLIVVRRIVSGCETDYPSLNFSAYDCVEDCTDGIDNDGDGLIDCADSDCFPPLAEFEIIRPECAAPLGSISILMNDTLGEFDYSVDGGMNFQNDFIFNNLDTGIYLIVVRRIVSGCETNYPSLNFGAYVCPEDCTDGIDNDGDGLIDCADLDCLPPLSETEIVIPECTNPLGSISIMMNDTLGEFDYSIDGGMSFQSDSIFNNLDTGIYLIVVRRIVSGCQRSYPLVRFEAPDCPEDCNDGIDNDGDGLIDCDDPDCPYAFDSLEIAYNVNCFSDSTFIRLLNLQDHIQISLDSMLSWTSDSLIAIAEGTYNLYLQDTITGCTGDYFNNPIIISNPEIVVVENVSILLSDTCSVFDAIIEIQTNTIANYSLNGGTVFTDTIVSPVGLGLYWLEAWSSDFPECIDSFYFEVIPTNFCIDTLVIDIPGNEPFDTCLSEWFELPFEIADFEFCEDSLPSGIELNEFDCLEIDPFLFTGSVDTVCVVACEDSLGLCDTLIVVINQPEVLTSPIAINDFDTIAQGGSTTILLIENDTLNTTLEDVELLTNPIHGTVTLDENGIVIYNGPDEDCGVVDQFTYIIFNGVASDTATVFITVLCPEIFIYSGFSPNGDGTNDFFVIKDVEWYPNSELTILNRWGNQVAYFTNYKNEWDGKWQGKDLPDGVYFYFFDDGHGNVFNGHVVIHR